MTSDGAVRAITDLFHRFGARRVDARASWRVATVASEPESVFPTKAFRKFVSCLSGREAPVLVDLGPVVGANVAFFGERLGCKIVVEDLYADVERWARQGRLEGAARFSRTCFSQPDASVDGILCWDVLEYVDEAAARILARDLVRMLRPGGVLLAFFGKATAARASYTKYVVVDEGNLQHRPYPATRGRQRTLLNRDIITMFDGLQVMDSFLLKISTREILFRKPRLERKSS